MNHPRRFAVVTIVLACLLCAVAWLFATYANSRLLEREAEALREQAPSPVGVALLGLVHEPALLRSSGHVQLRLSGGCTKLNRARAPVVRIDYTIEHWPTFDSLLRANWQLRPVRVFDRSLEPLTGETAWIEGTATRGYDGSYKSEFRVRPQAVRNASGAVELGEGHGTLALRDERMRLDATLARALLQLPGSDLEANGVTLHWNITQRGRFTGYTESQARLLRSAGTALEGLELRTRGTEQPGRLELQLSAAAGKLTQPEGALHELGFRAFAHNLEPQSFEDIVSVAGNRCGPLALFGESSPLLRAALQKLFGQNFSLEVVQLAARADDGALDGVMRLELVPSAAGAGMPLTGRLRASGELNASGATLGALLLTPRLRAAFRATERGLQSSFSFDQRTLTLNGQSVSPMAVNATLGLVDRLAEAM